MEIADKIALVNPGAARSIDAAIASTQTLITEHPRAGRRKKERDLRKVVVPRYGYLVYDRVIERENVVGIVTIRHPARARIAADA